MQPGDLVQIKDGGRAVIIQKTEGTTNITGVDTSACYIMHLDVLKDRDIDSYHGFKTEMVLAKHLTALGSNIKDIKITAKGG